MSDIRIERKMHARLRLPEGSRIAYDCDHESFAHHLVQLNADRALAVADALEAFARRIRESVPPPNQCYWP